MRNIRLIPLLAALCALLVAASVAAAALPSKAQYSGKTSDNSTVRLRLSKDGKQVAKMRIYYKVTCDDGRSGTTYTDILNLRIAKTGKFAGKGMYTGSGDGSQNKFTVSGTVTDTKAKGKFSLTATGTNSSTGAAISCKTGALRWSAPRLG